jgi:hypothetical protein
MKTRHFRGEQELPWIINSENYDYTYQNFINLKKSVTLMPGDIISTECTYNSSSRNTTTLVIINLNNDRAIFLYQRL